MIDQGHVRLGRARAGGEGVRKRVMRVSRIALARRGLSSESEAVLFQVSRSEQAVNIKMEQACHRHGQFSFQINATR